MAIPRAILQEGDTVTALKDPPLCISYKLEKSSLLLVKKNSSESGGSVTEDPLASTLIQREVVAGDRVKVLNVASISKESLKEAFMKCIQQADKESLFIFSYTGPAIQLDKEVSLKLTDFAADNPVTHVTSTTLLEWLSEASSVQPLGYALFILDCPFSKELSSALTDVKKATTPFSTWVFAIGTVDGDAAAVVLGALDYQSILHFFLNRVVSSTQFIPGSLPLVPIINKAMSCTTALSSLIITYDQYERILKPCTIEPKAKFLQRLPASRLAYDQEDETDSFSGLEFLTRLFDKKKPIMNLESKVNQWLYIISDVDRDNNPLKVLFENGALTGKDSILLTVICSLLYSIASIQVAQGKPQSITEPNMFIIAFINAMATIQIVQREVKEEVNLVDACKRSWEYFHQVVTEKKLNDSSLKQLYHKIENCNKKFS